MEEFEEIRPYTDAEVPAVVERLVNDPVLLEFLGRFHSPRLARIFPRLVRFLARRRVSGMIGNVTTIKGFQHEIAHYVKKLVETTMTRFSYSGLEQLERDAAYVFVSNHRDIAGDSMLVDYALHDRGFDTVRIAVGDNLVQRQFVTDLMKLNKSFFIKRSVSGAKKVYAALLTSSRFIHQTLAERQSVWIAQAEGRAKDAMDRTDDAVIKMLALAERKVPFADVIRGLHLVPVALSYEFDPCDLLKAKELAAVDAAGSYTKPPGEDLLSLARGLAGQKGRVHVSFGEPLTGEYDTPEAVAAQLDREIVGGLRLYPINLLALRELKDVSPYREAWAHAGVAESDLAASLSAFEVRLAECPSPLRKYWLTMYANPVLNKFNHGLPIAQSLLP